MKRTSKAKLALLFVVIILATLLFAAVAEAAAKDKIRNAWGKTKGSIAKIYNEIKPFIKSKAFWLNSILLFAALFILYNYFLGEKVGKTGGILVVMIIVMVLASFMISTKIVENDKPVYFWKMAKARTAVQFLFGPTAENTLVCAQQDRLGMLRSLVKSVTSSSEPPCCGVGSYWKKVKISKTQHKNVCKQAILRVNNSGAGLYAFLLAGIILYIIFTLLLKDKLGDKAQIIIGIMAALLAGLIANDRMTKDQILMIAGWAGFIVLGLRLHKTWGKKEGKSSFAGTMMAWALPYTGINFVLSMFGTSLWMSTIDSSQTGIGFILWDFIKGMILGAAIASLTTDVRKKLAAHKSEQKEKLQEKLIKENRGGDLFMSGLPGAGWVYDRVKLKKDMDEVSKTLGQDEAGFNYSEQIRKLNTRLMEVTSQLTDAEVGGDAEKAEALRRELDTLTRSLDRLESLKHRAYLDAERFEQRRDDHHHDGRAEDSPIYP
ncbi:hypothetical protein ACFL0V_04225 [Nanoarchaeota archaeon]